MKSGFVAILGLSNVGKSSLTNLLVGEKVSVVSSKAQTTRNKILGILNYKIGDEDYQMVLVDTPGIIKPQNKLNEAMMRNVQEAKQGVNATMIVLDANAGLRQYEERLIDENLNKNLIVVVNKVDLVNYDKLFPLLAKLNGKQGISHIVPISARTGKNKEELLKVLNPFLTDDVAYYDTESITDKSYRFLVSEIIREKILHLLANEVPHGIFVEIIKYDESPKLIFVNAEIVVERDSHKPIVIGKQGSMLKQIGTKSREEIEKLVNKKVMLNLFVKVKEDWRNKSSLLKDYGF